MQHPREKNLKIKNTYLLIKFVRLVALHSEKNKWHHVEILYLVVPVSGSKKNQLVTIQQYALIIFG